MSEPFLTVAAQPAYEIGRRAAEMLLDRLSGARVVVGEDVVLPFELIIRRSSAPPARPSSAAAAATVPREPPRSHPHRLKESPAC